MSDVLIVSVVLPDLRGEQVNGPNRSVTPDDARSTLGAEVTMRLLALVLLVPGLLAPTPASAAAAVCQGRPATIEAVGGPVAGTPGDDVIVTTGPDADIAAGAGDDLVCLAGGRVSTGPGDDSVVGTAAVTEAYLTSGRDRYAGSGGHVIVDEVDSLDVRLTAPGTVELYPTTRPGTGTVDAGGGTLVVFGTTSARVDLAAGTAAQDGLLSVALLGVSDVYATGGRVRVVGDDGANDLSAYGCNLVVSGGGGRDSVARVGNGYEIDLPRCRDYRSVLRGEGGPDRLSGRRGDDVLLGGPGRDVARGRGGVDRCRAEVSYTCER